ncbi:hypothetical protein N6P31_01285 [Pectobacterium betavasculorum]|uniref:hypothetical protein n=1 Tax=Pectobacterium betavasculorum TaxID=55207 RepID=UPI00313BF2BE
MAINYSRMRATATRLLTENGMTYDVKRKGVIRVVAGKEIHEPDLNFTATGVRTDYDPKEIDGTNILSGDVRIAFTAEAELVTGDLVEVDGKQHRIVKPHPVKPAKLVLCYQAQLRA